MPGGEFALIDRHFRDVGARRTDVVLGVGDDAALLDPQRSGAVQVAWCSATIDARTGTAGALAESCVDTAVQAVRDSGATPAWLTVALSMASPDERWVGAFAAGLDRACRRHGVRLVGGDTTAGADSVTVYATGLSPAAERR